MAGYIGTKAVNLSTTGADIAGDADVSGALDVGGAFTSQGIDDNATSTAMTLDGSGNLLVGKTSGGNTNTVGFEVQSNGFVGICGDGIRPVQINRKTSDGDIIEFRKDGTTVGSIGAKDGDLYIGTGDTQLRFNDGGDNIRPASTNGAGRDAAVDLGASNIRFKDLYLSGGVYLGGTGANNLLDDYEEGPWTPTIPTGTVRALDCRYTKIGNLVHLRGYFDQWSDQTSSNNLVITGLPFTPISSSETNSFGTMVRYLGFDDGIIGYMTSTGEIRFYSLISNANYSIRKHSHFNSASASIRLNLVYETTE